MLLLTRSLYPGSTHYTFIALTHICWVYNIKSNSCLGPEVTLINKNSSIISFRKLRDYGIFVGKHNVQFLNITFRQLELDYFEKLFPFLYDQIISGLFNII